MLKAAREQQALEDEMTPNGGKSKGLFRKSRKSSQQVLTTRGITSLHSSALPVQMFEGIYTT